MGQVFLLSLTAALNPTLLTATTVMLLLPSAKRLMLGYWLGAMMTSITLGIVIVFALASSGAVSTTEKSVSPAADIALGAIALVLAFVLGTRRHESISERRARRREAKGPPKWQQRLSEGTARTTFVIGAMLTLPGASYLAALTRLSKIDYAPLPTVLSVIAVNLIMLVLLEGPLVAFAVAPEWATATIARVRASVGRNWLRVAVRGLTLVGALLVVKGVIGLLQ